MYDESYLVNRKILNVKRYFECDTNRRDDKDCEIWVEGFC